MSQTDVNGSEMSTNLVSLQASRDSASSPMAVFYASEPPVDADQLMEEMRREEQDSEWIKEHMDELVEEHGIVFVAVKNKEVIATSFRLSELLRELVHRGISTGSVTVDVLLRKDTPP